MNKKGFTLIEIIGVVTVLSIILIVAVPSLTKTLKRNEQNKYNDYIDNLKIATENYVVEKLKEGTFFEEDKDYNYISLGDLIDAGYVKELVINPENDKKISRDTRIKVTKELDSTFKYDIKEFYILPSEYQKVEYIESTGSQYIDIEYYYKKDDRIEIELSPLEENVDNAVFGVYLNDNNVCELGYYSGKFRGNVGNITTGLLNEIYIVDHKYEFINEDGQWQYNGTRFGAISQNSINSSAYLFGRNYSSNQKLSKSRIYYLEVYRDDALIIQLIPCYRIKDNVIGLYDVMRDKFYINAGSGSFIKGTDA